MVYFKALPQLHKSQKNLKYFDQTIQTLHLLKSTLIFAPYFRSWNCESYGSSISTQTLAAGIARVNKPMLMSQVGKVCEVVCMHIRVFLKSGWWRCQYSCRPFHARWCIGSQNMSKMPPGQSQDTRWSVFILCSIGKWVGQSWRLASDKWWQLSLDWGRRTVWFMTIVALKAVI